LTGHGPVLLVEDDQGVGAGAGFDPE